MNWQFPPLQPPPDDFLTAIQPMVQSMLGSEATYGEKSDHSKVSYVAQLLWQRGLQGSADVPGFLNPEQYQPTSPFAFGDEMNQAIARLQSARDRGEKVAIWGDFDADGITATAVLWEGLGQFFTPELQLVYVIPNRLKESHGLAIAGIQSLAEAGVSLIVTCDTGSTNLAEINHANHLGMDVIVTDHHSLPDERPPVVAILNPRYFPTTHPLAMLSGVAVAYKLVEALMEALPDVPQRPLTDLLDLVAIGLIADLVELKGDCRYLAQIGIQQLQQTQRPGIVRLLELCKRSGDRPTDISFGIGPRINAISRIQGDARFCVELLTSRDPSRCRQLAEETELANTRRKSLQKEVVQQVRSRLAYLDLSTTSVIILADEQWSVGILGLVAGQIAQEYGKPVILLTMTDGEAGVKLAKGSARSLPSINLYQLVQAQAELLQGFGGHPMALGLSLPLVNLELFTEAMNRQLRQQGDLPQPSIQADLTVTVAELGQALFRQLKLLEPCGMGNPAPKLLLQNVWFERVFNRNIQDLRGKKQRYIKTEFELWDDIVEVGFPGLWWEHYADDVPKVRCDAIVELDFNPYKKRYEVRLLAVRPAAQVQQTANATDTWRDRLLDWRTNLAQIDTSVNSLISTSLTSTSSTSTSPTSTADTTILQLTECPYDWNQFQAWLYHANQQGQTVAIAYSPPQHEAPTEIWQRLVGIAKYLSRTGTTVKRSQITAKLGISDSLLTVGLYALTQQGFEVLNHSESVSLDWQSERQIEVDLANTARSQFLAAVQESQFRQQYFCQVPLETLRAIASRSIMAE